MQSCIAFVGLLFFAICGNAQAFDAESHFAIGMGADIYQNNQDYNYLAGVQAKIGGGNLHFELRQRKQDGVGSNSDHPEIYIRPENSHFGYSISSNSAMLHFSKDFDWE